MVAVGNVLENPYKTIAPGVREYTGALGYDARGNLTSSGSQTYQYNARNQLYGNGTGQLFYRGPSGELGQTPGTNYDWVDGQLALESGSAIQRRYVYGPGTDEPLVWYEGSGTGDRRFLHADERGSVVAVSDGSGATLAINTYDEHGIPGATNRGRFQYTGQVWIPELGLYDDKARMYSPTLGRFLQTDPIGYGDGLNWYTYVGGDPVNRSDPSGAKTDVAVVYGGGGSGGSVAPDIYVFGDPCRSINGCYRSFDDIPGLNVHAVNLYDSDQSLREGASSSPLSDIVVTKKKSKTQKTKFTINRGRPPGAKTCSAYGVTFLAPPNFNPSQITAAGRAGGWSPSAMNSAVGHYGSFDFQRSRDAAGNTTFYTQYQVASNVAVGAYLYGTGIPEILSNGIEDAFAFFKSSNFGNGDQIMGQEIGWDAAAGDVPISCSGPGQ